MKTLIALLFCLCALASAPAQERQPGGQQPGHRMRNIKLPQAEYDAVAAEMNDLAKAWNAGDVSGMSAHMVDDVEVITPTGLLIHGKQELDRRHAELMKQHFAGSHQSLTVLQTRFVRPRVAFCDVEVAITRYKSLPPGLSAAKGQPLRIVTRYLLTKDSRDWTISAAQSTVLHGAAKK